MRRLLVVVLALCIGGVAMAATTGTSYDKAANWIDNGDHQSDGREGGEDIGTAVVIPNLPFSDTGATCDNVNNYDEICPYSGSTSADVVYAFTPGANVTVSVDLCNSAYDTKTYIYAGGPGNLVACNDDAGCGYSGYQSKLDNINLIAGTTYYFVIDGYGGSCGSYVLTIQPFEPCVVDCPAGAQQEGEPPCQDGYYDQWDGGCNSMGWVIIAADAQGCGTVCGKSCTYLYQGSSYRDTDWFDAIAAGGTVTANAVAEFPLQFLFVYNADCNNLQYSYVQVAPCQTATLSQYMGAGVHFWLWVGASVFSGVPESDYVFDVCGMVPGQGVPTQVKTWGGIKSMY